MLGYSGNTDVVQKSFIMPKSSGKRGVSLNSEVAFILNQDQPSESESVSNKTFVLFGNPRGGTTMIANVVRSMGVFLGNDLPINLEDNGFNWDILARQEPEPSRADKITSIKKVIKDRNAQYDVWGWKYPRADVYFKGISPALVNPMLICVFRDVVASTWRGVVRRRQEPLNLMRRALDLQSSNLRLIEESKLPTLLVSYEKAIADPLQLVTSLNRFMSLGLSHDELATHVEKVNPELGYGASLSR